MKRRHTIAVRLSDDELARLDEGRPRGVARAVHLRQLLRAPTPLDVASREEVLAMLTAQARDGRVAAAIALERALREDDEPDPWAELGVQRRQQ